MDAIDYVAAAEALQTRVEEVANLLDLSFNYFSFEGGLVELFEDTSPSCSCCGPEWDYSDFPIEYLNMSDDELRETHEFKKLEADKARREAARKAEAKRQLEKAQARVRQAQSAVRTAKSDAEKELASAQKELERLQGAA